jgi:hypothetical protein
VPQPTITGVEPPPPWMSGEPSELVTTFVSSLERVAADISIDLTDDPPAILARTAAGRVFVAAWPVDDGLLARLRLEAMAGAPDREHIDEGALTYEVAVRSIEEVQSLAAMIERAHGLADRRPDSR